MNAVANADMNAEPRIDLHTHSRASDGTEPPAALVAEAVRTRLDVVAITDHDTFAGWAEARSAAAETDLELVTGVEISCFTPESGYRISLHMLGYWPDPENAPLQDALAELRVSREIRAEQMLRKISDAGYDVSWDELAADAAGGVVGRPHVARALVRAGLIPDVSSAFTPEWIGGRGARFYVDKLELPAAEAVSLVRGAGGVPVCAHPRAVKRGPTVSDETIRRLTRAGLAGVEVDHPDHDAPARAGLRVLAGELGLIPTGSSDWHGTNKPTPMGAELTTPEAFARLREQAA